MLLVVVGHSFLRESPSTLCKFIYSCHMPLFMMISGYFFSKSQTKYSPLNIIKKKVKQLLFPVLFWGTVYFIIVNDWTSPIQHQALFYYATIIRTLWFLPAVFFSILIVLSVDQIVRNDTQRLLVYLLFCTLFVFTPDIANSTGAKFMFPCFVSGVCLERYPQVISFYNRYKYFTILLLITAYTLLFRYWDFSKTFYTTTICAFQDGVWNWHILDVDLFRVIIGVIGSLLVLGILHLIYENSPGCMIYKPLISLGKVTLPFYCFHIYIHAVILYLVCDFMIIIETSFLIRIIYIISMTIVCYLLSILWYHAKNRIKSKRNREQTTIA